MTWEQEIRIRSKEFAQKCVEEDRTETAKNFLTNGISAEIVAKCTNLPLEQVLQLQKETQAIPKC